MAIGDWGLLIGIGDPGLWIAVADCGLLIADVDGESPMIVDAVVDS
jgi:hypothetical protein